MLTTTLLSPDRGKEFTSRGLHGCGMVVGAVHLSSLAGEDGDSRRDTYLGPRSQDGGSGKVQLCIFLLNHTQKSVDGSYM